MQCDNNSGHQCHTLSSPDGNLEIRFELKRGEILWLPADNCPVYSIRCQGKDLILESQMGLELGGAPELTNCFAVERVRRHEYDGEWRPPYGERVVIPDRCREMTVELKETIPPYRKMHITFRAYNEGAAFCYTIPEQDGLEKFSIVRERTLLTFPAGTVGYAEYAIEGPYEKVPIEQINKGCEWPLAVEIPNGLRACLCEAHLYDYSRMRLSPWKEGRTAQPALMTDLHGTVFGRPPFTTPWRAFIVGTRPGDLIERNHLIYNLNPPCAIADTSWIQPGKAFRDGTLSTPGGMACVDFAAEHNFKYVLFCWGWYGLADCDASDARRICVKNPMTGLDIPDHPGLDIPRVVEYARKKGVGIWMYLNHQALERQVDDLFPLFNQWGVVGVKPGFVHIGAQHWSKWMVDIVKKAAEHKLMVDIHDEYRPTGLSRTYPNLLTQEGIRGNENMPTSRHNCTLPFARYPAGAGDYTPCYFSDRIKTTHAHQLALPVVFYSPIMFLFWYDKPSSCQGEPEIEFWDHLPTVWDETRALDAAIGEHVTVARRSGDEWFVGSLTNEVPRLLEIPLDFLDLDRKYVAHIYTDAPEGDTTRTHVAIEKRTVNAKTVILARLAANGGHSMRLVPQR